MKELKQISVPSAIKGGHYRITLVEHYYEVDDKWIIIEGHKPGRRYYHIANFSVESATSISEALQRILQET